MMVTGLDGRPHPWRLAGHTVRGDDGRPRSSYHLRARELLRRLFPVDTTLEELPLPGCSTALYADFYLPLRKIMVEVQGEQHFKFCGFFHRDRLAYLKAQGRDVEKRQFCQINSILLIEWPYTESDVVWTQRIITAHEPDCLRPPGGPGEV